MKKSSKQVPKKKHAPREFMVEKESELLTFLLDKKVKSSRNSIKSILTRGQVAVDGKVVTQYNRILKPGQKVRVEDNKIAQKQSELIGISILHEDEDLIVINKDAGILSVAGGRSVDLTAHKQLNLYMKQDNPASHVFVIHRLDRDTSGVMIFAKNEATKEKMQKNWQAIVTERIYTALVEGDVEKTEDTISSWLTENPKSFKVHSSRKDNGGQHAVTHYKKLRSNGITSLLEVQLETGRKNQIRVHMAEIGHPVTGDKKYGSTINPMKRLGLHATTIAFDHPTTGKLVRYTSPVPKSFQTKNK